MRAAAGGLLVLALQVQPAPAGAQSPPPAPHTTIRGRVIAAADAALPGQPLGHARLAVIAGGSAARPVYADENGLFELQVPASAGVIRVTKSGWAPVDARPPSNPDEPLTIAMPRAAVILGRVVDAAGDPSVGAPVRVHRLSPPTATGPTDWLLETDDRGEFRLGNLVAGRYAVDSYRGSDPTTVVEDLPPEMAAMLRSNLAQRSRDEAPSTNTATVEATAGDQASVTLVQNFPAVSFPYAGVGGVITGTLLDEFGEPAADVSVRLWLTRFVDGRVVVAPAGRSRRVDDGGRYRLFHIPAGRYVVVATPDPEPEPGSTEPAPFLPVFYPGRVEISASAEIEVTRGQEASGIDMTVARLRGARVYGVALAAAGTALEGSVTLAPSQSTGPLRMAPTFLGNGLTPAPLSATPGPDGAFEIRNVPPGLYALQATADIREGGNISLSSTGGGATRRFSFDTTYIEGITEFAMQRLAVTDADIGPVTLATVPTSIISGRVTVEGPGRMISPADFGFAVANVDPDEVPAVGARLPPDVDIEPTGTFRITGLTGRSLIVLSRAPAGWWLKSVNIGGLNAATEPVDFGSPSDSRDDVTIVLASTGGALSGRVTGATDADAFSIVVFPVERGMRLAGSRYVRTTSPDADGGFALNSFPPAEYYAIAVREEDGDAVGNWVRPETLEALAPLAQRVMLGEGMRRTLDLPLQRPPR